MNEATCTCVCPRHREPTVDQYRATQQLMDALSALEHEQWIFWSQNIARSGLDDEQLTRWRRQWVPYAQLDETTKEHDRFWARKVIDILAEQGRLINARQER